MGSTRPKRRLRSRGSGSRKATCGWAICEALPFPDQVFDVVTGFNVFQYAANPEAALGEARRVARPGALVAVMV